MDRKIPPKQKVVEAIKKVMRERLKISSQEELARLALRVLRKENKEYTLTPTRAKRIALEIEEIEVKAKTRKSLNLVKIDKCPICESEIKEIKAKNLLNKEIVIGYKCTKCGYESDLEAFMPMKYIFILKK